MSPLKAPFTAPSSVHFLAALLLAVFLVGCGADSGESGNPDVTDDQTEDAADMTGDVEPDSEPDMVDPDMDADTTTDTVDEDMGEPVTDSDGDGISDADEGDGLVDTDGDGTPDSMDSDSDDDGIPDADEAGDSDPNTPPDDSDGDGTPDFQDTDSDDNGIPDSEEMGDTDGDGILDSADSDNDGDGLLDTLEITGETGDCDGDGNADTAGDASMPWDCDGDGTPDYNDTDSDRDTITDRLEGTADTDMDTFLDRYDSDSDNDGISDAVEAGDDDLNTPPVDTDMDGTPDYRDLDSDSDGLSDEAEVDANTDPLSGDSDGDGVSDLIEVAAGTDPNNMNDNPQNNGDFVFLVPYMDTTSPLVDTLEFRTNIQFADLYFGFDVTGSMGAELDSMRNTTTGVPAIIDQLICAPTGGSCSMTADCGAGVCFNGQCITDPNAGDGCIPDLHTGVGAWWELDTFRNLISVQADPVTTANGVPCPNSSTDLYNGGGCFFGACACGPGADESPIQPPACVANPSSCANNSTKNCASSGIGCPGFRSDAIRIYIQVTDADDQCNNADSQGSSCSDYQQGDIPAVGMLMQAANVKFIGLFGTDDQGGAGTAEGIAQAIGAASNTVDSGGNPFVYQAVDAAVVTQTVQAVRDIARGVPLNVTIESMDLPDDDGDALQFIDHLEVNLSGGNCTNVSPVADTNGDMYDDSFPSLLPGTPVCWDVVPVPMNTTVMATETPQLFKARLTVLGDGSPLDSRDVFFLIPPEIDFDIN